MSAADSKPMTAFFPVHEVASTTSTTLANILDIELGPREVVEWEVRPCGMLVQRRDTDPTPAAALPPPICVRVKHGADYHNITVNPQSTFGELKKLALAEIGARPQEQKLLFKKKVMDPTSFLDVAGVKDRSKLVLLEDPVARAQRVLETRRAAKAEKDGELIRQIGVTVDRHAVQVSAMKTLIRSKGKKVAEDDVLRLTGKFMDKLVELENMRDNLHGDVKFEWTAQVRKVRKLVEALKVIKIKHATPASEASVERRRRHHETQQQQQQQPSPSNQQNQDVNELKPAQTTVANNKWYWEGLAVPSMAQAPALTAIDGTAAAVTLTMIKPVGATAAPLPKVNWDLFS